jgi:nucleoside-diphosphate-sugar epimerase
MDLLLTGASGFLGRNFILGAPAGWRILALYSRDSSFPAFVERLDRPNVTAVRCDLMCPDQVEAVFQKYGREWEHALFLAAKVDIPWSVRDPNGDLQSNTQPLLHTLEHLRARRFVYFSSGAIYDGSQGEVSPMHPVSPTLPYAISKLACERYVEFYARRRRSIEDYIVVRFFGAYGPYEAPHKIYTRLIQAFAVEKKRSYTIYGSGRNAIDAMYVDDAVEAIGRILTGGHRNDTVNLAAGHPMTIESLVREAGEILGPGLVEIVKEGVAHECNEFWGSTAEMQEHFGFEPKVSLREGLTRFKEFLLARQTVSRG